MSNDNDKRRPLATGKPVVMPWLEPANIVNLQKDELPTQAKALLDLVDACDAFHSRQTDATFERLAAAVAMARTLKLY